MKPTCLIVLWLAFAAWPCHVSAEPASPAPQPAAEATKPCFQCKGTGTMKCPVPSCVKGQMDCPGDCLKLSTPGWQHLDVAGHGPDELWMYYPDPDGKGWSAYSQKHTGQVVKRKSSGSGTTISICPVCKGTAHVKCTTCKGAGSFTCTLCSGSGRVPESWTAVDNPKLKNRPTHFKLKDGSEVIGRKVIDDQETITVRTEKGSVSINKADLVPAENP